MITRSCRANVLPIDALHSEFTCDFETGILRSRVIRGGIGVDRTVGSKKPDGYLRVQIKGKTFSVHRVIWAMYHGYWPTVHLDHKDGNRSNNAISNLREADPSQNAANRKSRIASRVRKGITWHKQCRKWQAQISKDGKAYYLGLFDTEEAAHRAYAAKATEFFGEFARVA